MADDRRPFKSGEFVHYVILQSLHRVRRQFPFHRDRNVGYVLEVPDDNVSDANAIDAALIVVVIRIISRYDLRGDIGNVKGFEQFQVGKRS